MEHNPLLEFPDGTVITFSDIKTAADGREYITVYFETATKDGFNSMQINYPGGKPEKIKGYTHEQAESLIVRHSGAFAVALEIARENN